MIQVSIITPIYKSRDYIERCAVSLFEQDFDDIEYVFVNDCTPDNSVEILKETLERYPNRKPQVTIINHNENRGLGGSRKTGLENSTGIYIIHIDGDDWIEPNMVSSLYAKAKETNADIVASDFFFNYQDREKYKKENYTNNLKQDIENLWNGKLHPGMWNKLIKKELYINNQIMPSPKVNIVEDYYVNSRLFAFAKKIAYVPKAFLHYWQENENSICKNISDKHLEEFSWHIQSTKSFLKENQLEKQLKKAFLVKTLNYILWLSHWQYNKERVNDICPESNKLYYIWKNPKWSFRTKFVYSCAQLEMWHVLSAFKRVEKIIKRTRRKL